MPISRSSLPKEMDGKLRGARTAKTGLWANINRRKKLGISRPKSESTVSKKAYANMKAGFPKKKNKMIIKMYLIFPHLLLCVVIGKDNNDSLTFLRRQASRNPVWLVYHCGKKRPVLHQRFQFFCNQEI